MDEKTIKLLTEADELEKRAKQKRAQAQKALALARKAEAEAERKSLAELKHRLGGFVLALASKEGVGRRFASHQFGAPDLPKARPDYSAGQVWSRLTRGGVG